MISPELFTSSHSMLSVFVANAIDRVFLVPGESYLGILDALGDFPEIDVVTCRHESGAGFMACADGRLTRRPGVTMVSRGPGATNAAIAVHTAQQDAIPFILVIGQVSRDKLRLGAFQEVDYQQLYGSIAKWVVEVTDPERLAEVAFKAIRISTNGTPGPVVIAIPEDVQQQVEARPSWEAVRTAPTLPLQTTVAQIAQLLSDAERPLIIAGGALDTPDGRGSLRRIAEEYGVPVVVSFRQHDLFPHDHPLYAGDLGLANPAEQIATFATSDLIVALGTRLGDITTQGYRFPIHPKPAQILIHCYPDDRVIGAHFSADIGIVCDPAVLADSLVDACAPAVHGSKRRRWADNVRDIAVRHAQWPQPSTRDDLRVDDVIRELAHNAPDDVIICLDAGTFAAPVYRHFPFRPPHRLMAPLSGAMGYGTPAAIAAQLATPRGRPFASWATAAS